VLVSQLVPPLFEAYARILHRIDAYYENIDNPLSPAEIAILGIPPCEPLRSFVEDRRANSMGTRVRWRELAELLDVPLAPGISGAWFSEKLEENCWPRFLRPGKQWPTGEECAALVSALKLVGSKDECFFRFSDIPFIGKAKPPLFKGALDEVCSFLMGTPHRVGFEYWCPVDRNWCVCADYDLEVTIIGGSRKLISALLTDVVLECIEATPQTRVDPFTPLPEVRDQRQKL
jgi:hypothetical protein